MSYLPFEDTYNLDFEPTLPPDPEDTITSPTTSLATAAVERPLRAVADLPDLPAQEDDKPGNGIGVITSQAMFHRDVPSIIVDIPHPERCAEAAKYELTHLGLAERLTLHHGERLAWRPDVNTWMWFDGTKWITDERDGSGLAGAACRSVIRSVTRYEATHVAASNPEVRKAAAALESAKALGMTDSDLSGPQRDLDEAMRKASKEVIAAARKWSDGTTPVNSALLAARVALTVPENKWNSNPFLINFPNGTINLKHRTPDRLPLLRPHDPADRITMVTAVDYVETAHSDDLASVRAHLDQSGPGTSKSFLRFLGYCLTGATDAKTFVNLYGAPDAAKSTLTDALYRALGSGGRTSYAATLSPNNLSVSKEGQDAPQPSLDACRGKRFVLVPEAEHCFLASDLIKRLTGGDPVRTRSTHAAGGEWPPALKLLFIGNGPVGMSVDDHGMMSRLWPIEVKKIQGPLDTGLKHRLAEEDAGQQAVLRACVRAACAWFDDYKMEGGPKKSAREALLIPDDVTERKASFITQVNPLSEWIEEQCITGDEATLSNEGRCTTSRMMHAFNIWSARVGGNKMRPKAFGRNLDALGYRTGERTQHTTTVGGSTITEKGPLREGIRLQPKVWVATWSLGNLD